MVACPACTGTNNSVARVYTVAEAANHLVPAGRDDARHRLLSADLRRLFGEDRVQVRNCDGCGFWFADPFVAGTAEIYNLITAGSELYPSERFEFGVTIESLGPRRLSLLEIGAGDGAFLRAALRTGTAGRAFATEYDAGALSALRAIPGVRAEQRSPQQLAAETDERFDAICMFQVLEHLDSLDQVFGALRRLTATGGELFISVPNHASVTTQEELTGFWEMPPNHIGRWTGAAIESVAARHGFHVREHRYEPETALAGLWEMAKCRYQARAYRAPSLAGRVNNMSVRAVRGPVKRALAVWDLVMLAPHYGRIPPRSQWFRLGAG